MYSNPEVFVSRATLPRLADALVGGRETIFTINLAHMRMLNRDAEFLSSYLSASIVTLDSMVVNRLGFRGSFPVATGSDLLHHLIVSQALRGKRLSVIGNLGQVEANSLFGIPDINVVTPSFGFINNAREVASIITQIEQFGPDVVLIAVGAPQSEKLAALMRTSGSLKECSILCCGAALEFELGIQTRSPNALRLIGLEWLWRLARNPARLAPRYFSDFRFLMGHFVDYVLLKRRYTISLGSARIRFEAEPIHD